ncbi:alpha/beta hydrolase [Sphingosinicellaceae bacterium]|nr:alpha/beta hydrolase [Sphingosinicellaceae bacterium]
MSAADTPAPTTPMFPGDRIETFPRISVEVTGSGPDVIFIHGWGSSREVWREAAERLRHRYRLHLVQIAGFAGEPSRDNASGPVLLPTAEAIDAYIRAAKLKSPAVVGHSSGGTIALWLSEMHPEDIGKVLLVDAIPSQNLAALNPDQSVEMARAKAGSMRRQISQTDYRDVWIHAKLRARMQWLTTSDKSEEIIDWMAAGDRLVNAQAYYDLGMLDLRPGLDGIQVPVTLMYPVDRSLPSGMVPDEALYRAAYASVPHMRFVRIDSSRHYIMYDQPKVFDAQLRRFLRS